MAAHRIGTAAIQGRCCPFNSILDLHTAGAILKLSRNKRFGRHAFSLFEISEIGPQRYIKANTPIGLGQI